MSNPFALLDDEGASDNEQPQVTAKPTTAAASKGAAQAGKIATPQPRKQIPGQAAATRGKPRDDYPGRGGNRRVFNERSNNEAPPESEPQKREGKGQRGGKTGPRSRGGFGRTDRHSNTGKIDSEKQEHQGWGINDDGKRELADEQNGWDDAKADVSAVATPRDAASSPAPAEGAQTTEGKAPIVEEDTTKTYDEYMAERQSSDLTEKLGLSNLSLRKANEGADDAQWKNAKEFARDDDESDPLFAGNKESKGRKRPQKEGKTFLEVEARFPRPERSDRGRGRGDRGGRGRGEGRGRGRDGPRNDRNQRPVDANDSNAFPALS